MSSSPTLDRESFQKLLASAFAVQESGLKSQSLAAILELQRSIRMGHLDVDRASYQIAEWARSVANASGVAVGRLKGDQLIYTAGSGSAASYIGRRVMATFSTWAPSDTNSEILRVEDTTTDGRIEAAVCRQFGVKSLLILPIYRGRFVAGVLQVLFNEAHSFQDHEVRTYWILAKLVGEAMSQPPVIQKSSANETSANVAPAVVEEAIEHFPAPVRGNADRVEPAAAAQAGSHIEEVPPPHVAPALPLDRLRLLNLRVMRRMHRVRTYRPPTYHLYSYKLPVYQRKRISGVIVAAVTLVCTWILCTAGPATISSTAAPPLQTPDATTQQSLPSGASATPVTATPAPASSAPLKYQTVRYVASAGQRRSPDLNGRVKHFGDDVTVRYFTPRPATLKTGGDSEVRQVSNDVTVRYFKPKNLDPQAEPVAGGSPRTVAR